MKATVFYVDLTDEETNILNSSPLGWSSPIGVAYQSAQEGKFDETNIHMLIPAAEIDVCGSDLESAEQIWGMLQNGNLLWSENPKIKCLTNFPRSMMVGDLIKFEDGSCLRCLSLGFERFNMTL